MRWVGLVLLASCCGAALAGNRGIVIRFLEKDLDKLPVGWESARTGKGEGSVWKVVADPTAPLKTGFCLAQTAAGPGPLFNVCVIEGSGRDLDLSVAVKAVKGEIDQGGGPVWRYQDANNYYVAHVNPLEDNFRVYKVIAGKRQQLDSSKVKAPAGEWHTVRVVHQGDRIRCYLNGTLHLDVKDDAIQKAGKFGLWTKADAQTHFDKFQAQGL